jgi:hypothetical protein
MHLKHSQKHLKTLEKLLQNICNIKINTLATCVKHMQHLYKLTYNIHLKKQIKHLEQTLATYVYSYCNICNISI